MKELTFNEVKIISGEISGAGWRDFDLRDFGKYTIRGGIGGGVMGYYNSGSFGGMLIGIGLGGGVGALGYGATYWW